MSLPVRPVRPLPKSQVYDTICRPGEAEDLSALKAMLWKTVGVVGEYEKSAVGLSGAWTETVRDCVAAVPLASLTVNVTTYEPAAPKACATVSPEPVVLSPNVHAKLHALPQRTPSSVVPLAS